MTVKKTVYLFIYDGFADWETSYLMRCINESDRYVIKTIAIEKETKRSLSALSVNPDVDFFPKTDLQDIDASNTALVVLPGGIGWEEGVHSEIAPLVRHSSINNIMILASGSATLLLADLGLLNSIRHTSINADYVKTFSTVYQGSDYYVHATSVYHQGIITANGLAPVDLTHTALRALDLNIVMERSLHEVVMFE